MWKLRRSTSVTSTGARRSFETAGRPPNPPPTTTTWCFRDLGVPTALTISTHARVVPRAGAQPSRQAAFDSGGQREASGVAVHSRSFCARCLAELDSLGYQG